MDENLRCSDESLARIAEAQRLLDERAARKAAEAAAKKAYWDEYRAQLAKSKPSEDGGAKRRRSKGRIFRWN